MTKLAEIVAALGDVSAIDSYEHFKPRWLTCSPTWPTQ